MVLNVNEYLGENNYHTASYTQAQHRYLVKKARVKST